MKLTTYLLLFLPIYTFSQNCKCDFDFDIIEKKIQLYNQKNQSEKSVKEINKLLEKTKNNIHCHFNALNYLSDFYHNIDNSKMKINLDRQNEIIKNVKICPKYLSEFYLNRAKYHLNIGELDVASNYCFKIFKLNQNENSEILIKSKIIYSKILSQLNRDQDALNEILSSKPIILALKDSYFKSTYLLALAESYSSKYQLTEDKKYLDSCKTLTEKALMSAKKNKNRNAILTSYRTFEFIGYYLNDFELRKNALNDAFNFIDKKFDLYEIPNLYSSRAWYFHDIGDKVKCFRDIDTCIYYLNKIDVVSDWVFYNDFAEIYSNFNEYKLAYEFKTKSKEFQDSILNIKNTEIIANLEKKFEKVKKEKQISDLEKQNEIKKLQFRNTIIFVFFLIIIISFITYYFFKKNKQRIIEIQQRLNRSRMNPHFFFNALTSLQGIALKENDGKKVAMNLFKFSKLMRQTLEGSYNDLNTLEREIDFLKNYSDVQQLKVKNKISFEVNFGEINLNEILIPAMILQPIIENSFEHAYSDEIENFKISLNIKVTNKNLNIEVRDNGRGFKVKKDKNHVSRATQIIKDQLYLLNKKHIVKSNFEIFSDSSGTKVIINLPLIKNENISN